MIPRYPINTGLELYLYGRGAINKLFPQSNIINCVGMGGTGNSNGNSLK